MVLRQPRQVTKDEIFGPITHGASRRITSPALMSRFATMKRPRSLLLAIWNPTQDAHQNCAKLGQTLTHIIALALALMDSFPVNLLVIFRTINRKAAPGTLQRSRNSTNSALFHRQTSSLATLNNREEFRKRFVKNLRTDRRCLK